MDFPIRPVLQAELARCALLQVTSTESLVCDHGQVDAPAPIFSDGGQYLDDLCLMFQRVKDSFIDIDGGLCRDITSGIRGAVDFKKDSDTLVDRWISIAIVLDG